MSWTNPLALAGLGVAIGVVLVIAANVIRTRRRKTRIRRREQLKSLARRFGMELLGEHLPADLLEAAARFRGEAQGVDLDEVMVASDREGRYWLARRKVDGEEHQVFGFEIRGELNVRGLHLEPHARREKRPAWRRWWPTREEIGGRLRLSVRWDAEARRFEDALARQAVDRWIAQVAESCQASGKVPVGLEVHGERAWVHSLVTLEGVALGEFVRRALEVRKQVLDEVRRRPATLKTPAVKVSADDQKRERESREDTRPLFAVERADGADTNQEEKTVLLSAADLLREMPDPRSRRVRKRAMGDDDFEIPEPEEKVTLIRAR